MNFHLPVNEQTSPDQVCSALLFGFTSTKIADNQIQSKISNVKKAQLHVEVCHWLNACG